jgi:YVTN family beta-propeller protein
MGSFHEGWLPRRPRWWRVVVTVAGLLAVTAFAGPSASAEASRFDVVATVDIAVEPFGATTAPDGRTVWVANAGQLDEHIGNTGHTVTVLDARTYAIRSVIDVGLFPEDIAFAYGGRQAFVTNATDGTVSVIDTATRTVTQTIDLAAIPMTFPFGVIATRNSKKVYVTSVGLASDVGVAILDNSNPQNVTIGGAITLPGFTHRPALTPDGRLLVVPRVQIGGGPEAVLIDTATDRVVANVSLASAGGPQAATVTPDGRFAYVGIFGGVLGGDGGVAVVDLTQRTTVTVIATPAPEVHGVRVSPNGRFVIATNFRLGTVSVISTATNRIVANVQVGENPNDIAFTANGHHAFVTNQGDTTVSVVALPTH